LFGDAQPIQAGEQIRIHANIEASIERQKLSQQVVNGPVTCTELTGPFRTPTLTAGLEYAY
jgi:hypothetical protein